MFDLIGRNYYNPFREMENLERRIFGSPAVSAVNHDTVAFTTDITDEGDSYVLEADLPGFEKENIHLNLNNEILTITAERHSKAEDQDQKNKFVHMERSYGSYSRQFSIPDINTEAITAKYENGVLKLTLPKKQPAPPASRTLEIE